MQAAYSEIMRRKQSGGSTGYQGYQQQSSGNPYGYRQSGYGTGYEEDPFGGFGFGPFGFGFYGTTGGSRQTYTTGQESPELRAAANYIRNGFYTEAMNTLNGISSNERTAQWHYYCALANQGLGNNIRAREEARTAVSMEPNNYAYQNLLDQLQSPGQSYTSYQQPYAQPSGNPGRFLPVVLDVSGGVQYLQLVLLRPWRRILLLIRIVSFQDGAAMRPAFSVCICFPMKKPRRILSQNLPGLFVLRLWSFQASLAMGSGHMVASRPTSNMRRQGIQTCCRFTRGAMEDSSLRANCSSSSRTFSLMMPFCSCTSK